jgi:hypothetical protein
MGKPTLVPNNTERPTVIAMPTSRVNRELPTRASRPCRITKAAARNDSIQGAINMAQITMAPLLASKPNVAIRPAARVNARKA